MILFNLPLEPIENRYSKQWDTFFNKYLDSTFSNRGSFRFKTVYGLDSSSGAKNTVNFLDPFDTNIWKSTQLAETLRLIRDEVVSTKEKNFGIFVHDLWYPGLEQLKYIENILGISIKIFGILHAGTWDENDQTYTSGMQKWSKNFEIGWLDIADEVFVATTYHKNLITNYAVNSNLSSDKLKKLIEKISVTYLPVETSFGVFHTTKEKWIAFPHRLAKEKGSELLDYFKKEVRNRIGEDFELKITHEETNSKVEFYELLSKCKYSVSLADQETFGISMVESLLLGCIPIVPDKLSYPELFLDVFRYKAAAGYVSSRAVDLILFFEKLEKNYVSELISVNQQNIEALCGASIPLMMSKVISSLTRTNK